jgi:hypothetical protein
MTSKKVFYLLLGGFCLSIGLVIAGIVLGDIYLHKQSSKLVDLKLQNKVIEEQQSSLAQAKKDVEKYAELDKIAKQIIPQDKDQAKATLEILNIAQASGIKLASISYPPSTLGQAPAKPTTGTDSSSSSKTTPTTSPSITQVKPVDGLQNVYQYDITVVSDTDSPVTYSRLTNFLQRLEQNRRTAQVTQISIQPNSQNRNTLNFTLTLTLFVKP